MRLIVGLGNPGPDYAGTRHNVGFEALDLLARRHGIAVKRRGFRAVIGEGVIEDSRVILAKPMTYMNLSGEAVGAITRRRQIPPENMIVLVDDAALPTGAIRLRLKGSSGGHNGLESIERSLGTRDYPRVRIGVGGPSGGMVEHVLGRFRRAERKLIEEAVERAADSVEIALREDFEKAMNQYNRPATYDSPV